MSYGGLDELFGEMTVSVRNTRKTLRELFKALEDNNIIKAKILCIMADKELLDSLDSFNEKSDGVNAEGKKCKPEWVKKQKGITYDTYKL